MQTKQELILQEYRKLGFTEDFIKDFVNDNGWCKTRKNIDFHKISTNYALEYQTISNYLWRPASLSSLETNNGWYFFGTPEFKRLRENQEDFETFANGKIHKGFVTGATHWRPYSKDKPLYK